jgi:hypothetical protein
MQQLVVAESERDRSAASQGYGAKLRLDQAAIGNLVADQCRIAAMGSDDRTFIDHAALAGTAERAVARRQAVVVQIQRRSHQTAHIHLRALTEQNPIRVDQPHLAVRIEMTVNLARCAAENTVDRNRAAIGLLEVHRLVRRDIEALPTEAERRSVLHDGGGIANLLDLARARHNLSAGWTIARINHAGRTQRGRERRQHQYAATDPMLAFQNDGRRGIRQSTLSNV